MSENVLPPRCAARFRVEGKLGKGGAGMVYRAIQVDLERPVAIKVLHREVLAEPSLVERFKSEARITAQLTHPSIVRILDHDVEDGIPWIAYELLTGPPLRQHLAPGPLKWQEALTIAIQVAGALDVAHAAGVLHRDVKPDNVLGASPGRWKVTDFGIAKRSNSWSLERTQSGLLMGTPAYLAPEHITSGEAEPASDIYALGVTLFEMLTGQRPFTDPNPMRLLEKHLSVEPPAPSALAADIPSAVDALVLRALAKTPAERWASAGELRRAMVEVLGPDASVDLPKLEADKLGESMSRSSPAFRVPDSATNRSGSNLPLGHLPPPRMAGGASPERVRDLSAPSLAVPPEIRRMVAETPVTAVSSKGPADRSLRGSGARPAGVAPLAAVGTLLVVVAALVWPRTHAYGPPAPASHSATPSPASAGIPDWELARIRADLAEVIRKKDERNPDFKELAQDLIPGMHEFAKARDLAARLVKEESTALSTMQRLAGRMVEEYPTADRVPDAQALTFARVCACRARAWCWVENTRITLEVCERAERAHLSTEIENSDPLTEMTREPFPPGVVVPLFPALDAIGAAMERLSRARAPVDAELGDLLIEVNFLAVNLAWREWAPSTDRRVQPRVMRLREVCAQLPPPAGPALGRVTMALWDLGSSPVSQLRFARERLQSALKELEGLSAQFPALGPVTRRVQDQILATH